MERSSAERKPNRFFRGQIIRAAIAEALELGNDVARPLQSDTECSGDYDILGIGAMDSEQLNIPQHWRNWNGDVAEG